MKILSIIPARGGSKGIPNKNIINICGKPLIEYSISLALELKSHQLVSEVIVSTDSIKISALSKSLGATVPFLRPKKISGDKSKSIDFILHALEFFEQKGVFYDAILLLQPTSPIRSFNLLKDSIELFATEDKDSLISCYKEEYINELVMYKKSKDSIVLEPLTKNHNKGIRRQEHGDIFVRNGAIYLTKTKYLKETQQIISDNPLLIEMRKSHSINLDTLEDVELLKKILCK